MKVGDLLSKRSTGDVCILVEFALPKFGTEWIKVMRDGEIYKKWVLASKYEVIELYP
tara:strand:- start:86 stop:256 length:171 start_codon:yes stop_codon:yes gene_type:complete